MAESVDVQLAKLDAKRKAAKDVLDAVNAEMAEFRAMHRESKLAALKQDIADYGFTAADLFGVTVLSHTKPRDKTAKRGPKVVNYRDDHGNTWGGGKGPRPAWVKSIENAGGDIESYRISNVDTKINSEGARKRLAGQGGKSPEMNEIPRRK